MADEIHIAPYDPTWEVAFAIEAQHLTELAPDAFLCLEHIGSTAVPGVCAKPVIDIMGLVASLADARATLVERLATVGYAFWYDNLATDRLFFVRGLPPAPQRTHHLHLTADSAELARRLAFRDALRSDPALRDAYGALKMRLAERHHDDREAYTAAKADFIAQVVGIGKSAPQPRSSRRMRDERGC